MSKKSNRLLAVTAGALLSSFATSTSYAADAVVDIYTPYTTYFLNSYGGDVAQVRSGIFETIGVINSALASSQIDMRVNVVGIEEIDYTTAAGRMPLWDFADNNGFDFFGRRDAYGADMMALFMFQNSGGETWNNFYGIRTGGFGDVTAHEFGHTHGCGHGYEGMGVTEFSQFGSTPIAKGYRWDGASGTRWKTIMISNYDFNAASSWLYSNPNVTFDGTPAGVAGSRNNAQQIYTERFRFTDAGQLTPNTDWNAKWVLINRATNIAIAAPNNQSGAALQHSDYNGGAEYHWQFHRNWWNWNESWVYNPSSQKYLTIPVGATNGAAIVQQTGAGLNGQKFQLESLPSGHVKIIGANSSLVGSPWYTWVWRNDRGWLRVAPAVVTQDVNSTLQQYELRKVLD